MDALLGMYIIAFRIPSEYSELILYRSMYTSVSLDLFVLSDAFVLQLLHYINLYAVFLCL